MTLRVLAGSKKDLVAIGLDWPVAAKTHFLAFFWLSFPGLAAPRRAHLAVIQLGK